MNIKTVIQELKRFNFEFDTNIKEIKQNGSMINIIIDQETVKKTYNKLNKDEDND